MENLGLLKSSTPSLSGKAVIETMTEINEIVSHWAEPRDCEHDQEVYDRLKSALHNFSVAMHHIKVNSYCLFISY